MDRRLFLTSVAALLPAAAFAAPPTTAFRPILRDVENIRRMAASSARLLDPALANITGFALFDTETGKMLDSYQPDLQLPPASVSKALTAVYARSILGSEYRFVIRLVATGPVVDGIVQGDVYLVGGGDPALDTDELAELAAAAVLAGVKGVRGRFFVDGSALPNLNEIDRSQPVYLGYNPSVSGLNLNFNRVYFEWKQAAGGYDLTLDARGEANRPLVRWVDIKSEDRGAPVFAYSNQNGHDHWSVARSALGKGGGRWLPVRQPADYVGEVFRTLAAKSGLTLPAHKHGVVPVHGTEIARFESKNMDDVLRWMLKYSNNLTAECIGLTVSKALGRTLQNLQSSAASMGLWVKANLNVGGLNLRNHSGLSDKSRVSAAQMAGILGHSQSRRALDGLLKPFSVFDLNGKALEGINVNAKTGTLNFVRGLAGYLEKGGRKYSFAIFAADLPRRENIPMAARERPRGAKSWSGQAKHQEQLLLRHWLDILP